MEENDPNLQPLDIAGVAFFDADGESNMPKFGKFFKTLGLRTFAFYDLDYKKKRKAEQAQALAENFEINVEHAYKGFEDLLVAEVPVDRLWSFLESLKANGEHGNIAIPDARPPTTRSRPSPRRLSAETKAQAGRPAFLKSANSTSCRLPPHSSSRPCSLCSHRRRPSTRAAATTPICSPDHERALPAS